MMNFPPDLREMIGEPFVIMGQLPDGSLGTIAAPGSFGNDPYEAGVALALCSRVLLEAMRQDAGRSKAMEEQDMAALTDAFLKDMQIPDDTPRVARIEPAVPKFSVREIREWLEGWKCVNGDGVPIAGLPAESILTLLEDDQDGIAVWRERQRQQDKSDG